MENLIKTETLKTKLLENKERLNLDYPKIISIFKKLYNKPQKHLEKILNIADEKIPFNTSKEALKISRDLQEDKYFYKDLGFNYYTISEENLKKISTTIKATIASYLLSQSNKEYKI
jgi:hypothetical protein